MVVSSSALERLAELDFKEINELHLKVLLSEERRSIPFLRIWCLAEINCACIERKPLIIFCGRWAMSRSKTGSKTFRVNTPLLYHMQFLVSVKDAEAEFAEDKIRILKLVEDGVGFGEVDNQVRGAIVGAMVCSKNNAVLSASLGDYRLLNQAIKRGDRSQLVACLGAAAATGFESIVDYIIDQYYYYQSQSRGGEGIGIGIGAVGVSPSYDNILLGRDTDGMTALMHCCRGGHIHLIKKILSNAACSKAYVDTLSNDNWTALAFAAQFGSFEMLRLLVEAGNADVNIRLGGGHIALTLGLQVGLLYNNE